MSLNLYQIDVPVFATVYVKAATAEAAAKLAREAVTDATIEIVAATGDIEVSEEEFESEALPTVSLSPAMSFGEFPADPMMELSSEDVPAYVNPED